METWTLPQLKWLKYDSGFAMHLCLTVRLVAATAVLALDAVGSVSVPPVLVLRELGHRVVILGQEAVAVEVTAGGARVVCEREESVERVELSSWPRQAWRAGRTPRAVERTGLVGARCGGHGHDTGSPTVVEGGGGAESRAVRGVWGSAAAQFRCTHTRPVSQPLKPRRWPKCTTLRNRFTVVLVYRVENTMASAVSGQQRQVVCRAVPQQSSLSCARAVQASVSRYMGSHLFCVC